MEIDVARSATTVWQETKIQNLKSIIQSPSWTVWVGAFVLAVYLALLPWIERTWRATGDEPHYLLTAHSLVQDGDFDLTNNYARLDYLDFYFNKEIIPQIRLSPTGRQILDHHLGLPVLIAPAYALAGREGVLIFQALLGGLLAALTFKLALLVSRDEMASLLATLFVSLSPPLLMYNYLIYPELLGALLTTLVLYFAISKDEARPTSFILTLFALITLPWLNRRFVPLAILLALLVLLAWWGKREGWKVGERLTSFPRLFASPLTLLAVVIVSIGLLGWFNSQLIKVGEADITAVPTLGALFWDRAGRGLAGWLVDQQRGLFIFAPVYVFALWGLPFLLSDSLRQRNRYWFVLLPFLLSLGVTALAGGFWIAWELGPRFLVVALPATAPLLALAWHHYGRQKVWRGLVLFLFGLSLSNTLVILQNPELPYKSSLPLYYAEKFGLPLTEWLPDLAAYERLGPAVAGVSTEAQVVDENGEKVWLAQPGSPVGIVRSNLLPDLSYGHYRLTWQLRAEPGLPPSTELVRLSLKTSGGGQAFNKIITAADLPADGSYGPVEYSWLNPTIDRWRTPLVLNAVSSGQARIWAKDLLFAPNLFYGWLWPYLVLAILLGLALLAWFRYHDKTLPQFLRRKFQFGENLFTAENAKPAEKFNEKPQRPQWPRRLNPAIIKNLPQVGNTVLLSQPPAKSGIIAAGLLWGIALVMPLTAVGWLVYDHQKTSYTYTAGTLSHFVGRAAADAQAAEGQAWLVDPQVDPPQKAVYGPWEIFEAGRYRVAFRLKLAQTVVTGQDLARLEVAAAAHSDPLISQSLRGEHFTRPEVYHDFVLTVTNPRRQALSFEVYYLGLAPLLIDRVTITRMVE